MQQEKIRTIHVYFEEEEPPSVDVVPESDPSALRPSRLPLLYFMLVALWGAGIPVFALLFGLAYPATYDATHTQTITLTLSLHPNNGQVPLYALPAISVTKQATIAATGSQHQDATQATGLITFYNGAFTTQTVPTGTTLTGKDGVTVVTEQTAIIPAATPTTPPTSGTVSVIARSSITGAAGNIPASDIDQACCLPAILAQNLYPFSGGHAARDIAVLTQSDITNGRQTLAAQVGDVVSAQAQQETKPGFILLPLDCKAAFSASHQAGEEAASSLLALTKTCRPLAYAIADIEMLTRLRIAIPQGYHLVSFSALVVQSNITAQGGTLTVEATAYIKHNVVLVNSYRFAGE